ncbi:MAG: hypothetical protein WBF93_05415, partial [Pirellulales bacterium]
MPTVSRTATIAVLILVVATCGRVGAAEQMLELPLQTRDPQTGEVKIEKIKVNPKEVGVVAVDMWNWHWCKTSTMRVGALVPRMNRCLEVARDMGMQVFLCPSDVTDNYVGTPQLESLTVVQRIAVPKIKVINSPPAVDGGGCTCAGKHRCQVNFGWDGMAPDLVIGPDDLMPNDAQMLYSVCQAKGLKHLIYMGVHTQACLLGKSIGLKYMTEAGMHCILARDLTDAHGRYEPEKGITPDDFTAEVVRHFEKYLSPTINMGDTLRAAGKWDESWIVDPIRIAPWGIPTRPHLFEDDEITVTLTSP